MGYTSASGSGGGSSRSNPRQKKNKRGERTPLVGGRNRNRSDYEDLDDETFNNWPSKISKHILHYKSCKMRFRLRSRKTSVFYHLVLVAMTINPKISTL